MESKFLTAAVGEFHLERFVDHFPKTAEDETRFFWTAGRKVITDPPIALEDYYCVDPSCDCNRVMIGLRDLKRPNETIASISYAFDRNDPDPGPYIDPTNPCTALGREIFPMVEHTLTTDAEYVARLKRHYKMMKDKSAGRPVSGLQGVH